MDGDVFIDSSKIEPKQLCERGGEKITIPLSFKCGKRGKATRNIEVHNSTEFSCLGFHISCNGSELTYRGFAMEKKNLLITSLPRTEDDDLHLVITRSEHAKTDSEQRATQLFDGYLPYVEHGKVDLSRNSWLCILLGDHPHGCDQRGPLRNRISM